MDNSLRLELPTGQLRLFIFNFKNHGRLHLNFINLWSGQRVHFSALAANSSITFLDVSFNQIGDVGAKALAAANTIITTLNMEGNRIGDEGAKALAANATFTTLKVSINQIGVEGAKALAANETLRTLNVSSDGIGEEGIKALAANKTLTSLDVRGNEISTEWQEQLDQAIARNNQQLIKRRDQFTQKLMILAADKANVESTSSSSLFPKEVMLYIISLIDFRSSESIGKSAQQIMACSEFIFSNTKLMKESLTKSSKTKRRFKISEKITDGQNQSQFFFKPQKSTKNLTQEKSMEQLTEDSKVTEEIHSGKNI